MLGYDLKEVLDHVGITTRPRSQTEADALYRDRMNSDNVVRMNPEGFSEPERFNPRVVYDEMERLRHSIDSKESHIRDLIGEKMVDVEKWEELRRVWIIASSEMGVFHAVEGEEPPKLNSEQSNEKTNPIDGHT